MSLGYRKASDKPRPFEFVEAFPAGSVATTARDMSTFMIAHLQDGKFGDKQILRPETAKLMHTRTFGSDDRLNGMALGFYEESRNGKRIIGHGGDTELFHSDLHLILAENVGLFVSYNSAGKGEVSSRGILFDKFLDRYFPYTPPAPGKIANAKADSASIAGLYKNSRRFESSFLKLLTLLGQMKVIPNADGTISLDALKAPSGALRKFEEIEPFHYREVHGQDELAFKKDSDGRWQFQVEIPVFIFQQTSLLENKYFNFVILFFGLSVVSLTVLLWPVGALIRKHYARPLALEPPERRRRLYVRLVCLLFLVLFVGWAAVLSATDDITAINALPRWVIIFGNRGCPLFARNDSRCAKCVSQLAHRRPVDLGKAARRDPGIRVRRARVVLALLETHELQRPLLDDVGFPGIYEDRIHSSPRNSYAVEVTVRNQFWNGTKSQDPVGRDRGRRRQRLGRGHRWRDAGLQCGDH